jgi:phage gpG-like protein
MQIKVELTPEAQALKERVRTAPPKMLAAIADAFDKENRTTVGQIQQKYLSFGKGGPVSQIGCRVQTNRLRGSMRASAAQVQGQTVVSSIGSNVRYAAVQEFGYHGPQNVSPFTRHLKSRDVSGKIGERRAKVASGVSFVKGFTRQMNIGAREFTQRGIAERLPSYQRRVTAAVVAAINGS